MTDKKWFELNHKLLNEFNKDNPDVLIKSISIDCNTYNRDTRVELHKTHIPFVFYVKNDKFLVKYTNLVLGKDTAKAFPKVETLEVKNVDNIKFLFDDIINGNIENSDVVKPLKEE